MTRKKSTNEIKDVLIQPKHDRRLLSHVPDPEKIRGTMDRRGSGAVVRRNAVNQDTGRRFWADFQVRASSHSGRLNTACVDISQTGILIKASSQDDFQLLKSMQTVRLKFIIPPGVMEEGMEKKRLRVKARQMRVIEEEQCCAFTFAKPLYENYRRKDRTAYMASLIMLFTVSLFVLLMRSESFIYFRFNKFMYLYSIITALFLLSRYLFGALYKPVPVNTGYEPGVTIIIPCFNEEKWIDRTILSCMDQNYPVDKLEVIVVDDCSTDKSVERIHETIAQLHQAASRFQTEERLRCVVQPKNAGKRHALAKGAAMARHDLIVFVDSDSFLEPDAIRNLVQPFQDPKMAGVSGRTDVANSFTNVLTRMQSVRYYIAFRIMKAAESYFDGVSCLSGPLSCYRKSVVMEYMDEWLNQQFLGQRATFGDDRSLTNFVLRHHRTGYQDTAVVTTIVPNTHRMFLKQQMRWKRSWLRESMIAASFIWRKEPFLALFFYIGLLVPVAAPAVVIYNLIITPLLYHVFPVTFLLGLLMMSLLMSFAQLFFRKSTTWLYGMWFCIYYVGVLLWQMPVAWFTFWKSTWGTRMTPEDIKARERRWRRRSRESMAGESAANANQM